jgi:hypothetical protein
MREAADDTWPLDADAELRDLESLAEAVLPLALAVEAFAALSLFVFSHHLLYLILVVVVVG